MIQNSAEINFGGLKIAAVHSNDHPNYEITVTTTATIFKGSPAEFEAMCESHQLLKDAMDQIVNSTIVNYNNSSKSLVIIDDMVELRNAIINGSEALRRAD